MKRKIAILFVGCFFAFLLTACGAVSEVEDAIEQIGLVTMESREDIENAEKLYESLPAEKKPKVENYDTLTYARNEYDRLSDFVEAAENAINAIGEVTEDSGSAIELAQDAVFSAMSEGLLDYVKNYGVLQAAEDQYAQILLEQAQKLLSQRKYQEAYDQFNVIVSRFAGTSALQSALDGEGQALVGLAEKLYNAGKLEETMYALDDLVMRYGNSDVSDELYEKVQKRLTQQRPQNGKTFKNTVGWGQGEFTVSASSQDACIKLEDIADPSKYILFYVRSGEEATVKVKDGRYIAKYTTGEYWFSQESMFGQYASFTKAEDIMEFTTTREGSYTYYSAIEITLYQVVGGNMETTAIGSEDF